MAGTPRALEIERLNSEAQRLLRIAEDPGPLMVNGDVVTDPSTGTPLRDTQAMLQALLQAKDIAARIWRLVQPPITAATSLKELQAFIARVKDEIERAEDEAREDGP